MQQRLRPTGAQQGALALLPTMLQQPTGTLESHGTEHTPHDVRRAELGQAAALLTSVQQQQQQQ